MHPSEGIHTKYEPSPPLPLAPRMTPTQRILAHLSVLFLAFFSVRFPNVFFMNFGFDPGPKNRLKSHPGTKKCVPGGYFLRFLARAGVSCVFRPIWSQKTMKNQCVFRCAFLTRRDFFVNPVTLDFAGRRGTLEGFQSFRKEAVLQKKTKKHA